VSAIGVGSGGDESADLDAAFARDGIEADEIHRDVLPGTASLRAAYWIRAHLVIAEGYV
jgi:hypothetical protein